MRIGVGLCYYNDLKSLERSLPTYAPHVDHIFAVDGRFSFHSGEDYSSDGSREYVQSFPNVVHADCVAIEHEKRNVYLKLGAQYKCDVMLMIDSDEYVADADWPTFRENLEKIRNHPTNIHGVKFYYTKDDWTLYPRIWLRPQQCSYYKAHCIFKVNGNVFRSPSDTKVVEGISMRMDDSLRSEAYLQATSEYQQKMLDYERPIRQALREGKLG